MAQIHSRYYYPITIGKRATLEPYTFNMGKRSETTQYGLHKVLAAESVLELCADANDLEPFVLRAELLALDFASSPHIMEALDARVRTELTGTDIMRDLVHAPTAHLLATAKQYIRSQ